MICSGERTVNSDSQGGSGLFDGQVYRIVFQMDYISWNPYMTLVSIEVREQTLKDVLNENKKLENRM